MRDGGLRCRPGSFSSSCPVVRARSKQPHRGPRPGSAGRSSTRRRAGRSPAASRSGARTGPGTSPSPRRPRARPSRTARRRSATRRSSRCTPRSRPTRSSSGCPPGRYTLTVERGKEYHPERREVTVGDEPVDADRPAPPLDRHGRAGLVLGRHAHPPDARRAAQRDARRGPERRLPADSTGSARRSSRRSRAREASFRDPGPDPIRVDATHLIVPRNTEYEIFTVGKAAAHPRGVLRAEPQDAARPGRAAGRPGGRAGPTRGGPDRAGQAQLALVDGAGAGHAGRPVRAVEQPRLADRVRLPRLRRAAGRRT